MADRKVGVVLKSVVFYVYISVFYESCVYILRLKNETNIPFDLIKTLTSIRVDCKTLHVDAAIFIS